MSLEVPSDCSGAAFRVLAGPLLKVHQLKNVLAMDLVFEPFAPACYHTAPGYMALKYPRRSSRQSGNKVVTHGDTRSLPGYL